MTRTFRKATILSLSIIALAALLAVLLLKGQELDPNMGPGKPDQAEEPTDKPSREEATQPLSLIHI